jgi:hypothetical protein
MQGLDFIVFFLNSVKLLLYFFLMFCIYILYIYEMSPCEQES